MNTDREELKAIQKIIRILDGMQPFSADRVLSFVLHHQKERFARYEAEQRQRQTMANETVAR